MVARCCSDASVTATADLIADDGPFPLVVYSHGSGGQRYIHSSFTEAVASHGHVVVAPDRTGNTLLEQVLGNGAPIAESAVLRPDGGRVVDAFLDPSDDAVGEWAGHVDAERIAVAGHSFGGFTAIAMATGFGAGGVTVEPDGRVDAIITFAPATGELLLPDERIDDIDDVRAADITNTYAVAFLDQVLRSGNAITFEPPTDVVYASR